MVRLFTYTTNSVSYTSAGGENAHMEEPTPASPSNGETACSSNESKSARASVGEVDGVTSFSNTMITTSKPVDSPDWFKRNCIEVLATHNSDEDNDHGGPISLSQRGLYKQLGADKVAAVFINSDLLWNSTPQILKYCFPDGRFAGTEMQKQKVRNVIDEWTWYANVEFIETTSTTESNIRVVFNSNDGSWSYIGRQCDAIPITDATMNLAWIDKANSAITDNERAVVLHEFGHALGLLHEHQSPAHGGPPISNVQAAIDLYTHSQGLTIQQVYDQIINVYNMSDVSNFFQVDIHSIMHHPQTKEITGLANDISYQTELSDLDKAYMILQYPRKKIHPKAQSDGWTFEKALNIMGVPDAIKMQVLRLLQSDRDDLTGEISPRNIRKKIEDWTRSVHSKPGTPPSIDPSLCSTGVTGQMGNGTPPSEVESSSGDRSRVEMTMKSNGTPVPCGPGSFIWELYHKLNQLYCPADGQYFALQFPTRFLDQQPYTYKLDNGLSCFNKPIAVCEAEFALTDQLYPVAAIVGGPNGQSLSKNYVKALNSLIPTFENTDVRKQREKMRAWLMKETKLGNAAFTMDTRLCLPGISAEMATELSTETGMLITSGASSEQLSDQVAVKKIAQQPIKAIKDDCRSGPRGMTRMEYSDSLMQAYLNDRKVWELKRDEMVKDAAEKAGSDLQAIEKLTRTLAHVTAIEEAKLASKYADAVVRGYSHTVRGFMGHLDIKSTAESLQDAKDTFRESELSSVYAASKVYPVAMQPIDWFEALDTGFTREDLSQDPELIRAAVKTKSQLIDALENQIANLRSFNKGDPTEAKKKMDDAAKGRESKIWLLNQAYTASTISAVTLAIEVAATTNPAGVALSVAKGATETLKAIMDAPSDAGGKNDANKKTLTDIFGGDEKALNDIGKQMDEVAAATLAVNQASRLLTEATSEYATAVAGDTRNMVESLQRQLTNAKNEFAELQESFTIAHRAPPTTGALDDIGSLPQENGRSRWSEIHIGSNVSNSYTVSSCTSSSSVSSFNCNFWLGSYSSILGSSQARNETRSMSENLRVEVGMRTTYVTINRSEWFDPSVFDMSKSFMQATNAADYVPWSTWKKKSDNTDQTPEEVVKAIIENSDMKPVGYLPAFPAGYVLVKDCVIKITPSTTDLNTFKKTFDKQSKSSNGFLCFSRSSTSRSSNDNRASTIKQASDGIIVRIPGPQILGYIMQLVGKDDTQSFQAVRDSEIFTDDMDTFGAGASMGLQNTLDHPVSDTSTRDRQAAVDGGDNTFLSNSAPAAPNIPKPTGHLIDALQTALGDGDVAKWLNTQPEGTKDELWAKLSAAFGKVSQSG